MKKLLKILTMVAAVLTTAVVFATCKQFRDDPEEMLSYWTSEVVPIDFSISVPYQTSNDGALCIPSSGPVTLTIKLRNPRNFTLVMPTSSDNAGKVIYFPDFSTQPTYSSPGSSTGDYTLKQTADDKLELTYKSSFLKKYEWSSKNIGPEIILMSTDGRKFSKKFNLNLRVNTPPPTPAAVLAQTTGTPHKNVLCLKVPNMDEPVTGGKLHKDIAQIIINGTPYPLTVSGGNFVKPSDSHFIGYSDVTQLAGSPAVPSGSWILYYNTDKAINEPYKAYTITLMDDKGLVSQPLNTGTYSPNPPAETVTVTPSLDGGTGVPIAPFIIKWAAGDPEPNIKIENIAGTTVHCTVQEINTAGAPAGTPSQYNTNPVIASLSLGSANEKTYKVEYHTSGTGYTQTPTKTKYYKVRKYHRVTFDATGGTFSGGLPSHSVFVPHNTVVTEPTPPTKEGHTFSGWYTDTASGTQWNFSTLITEDKTLYSKWTVKTYKVEFKVDGGVGGSLKGTYGTTTQTAGTPPHYPPQPHFMVNYNSSVSFEAVPNYGWEVYRWSVVPASPSFSGGNPGSTSATLSNIREDMTVMVKFKQKTIVKSTDNEPWQLLKEIVKIADENATITINGTITATNEGTEGVDANWGEIFIDKDLTIQGTNKDSDILDANSFGLGTNAHRIFTVQNGKTLTLKKLTLKNGKADKGGGIYAGTGTTVNLDILTTIQECKATDGGAIYNDGGTLTIKGGSVIKGNEVTNNGGAFLIKSGSLHMENNCIIEQNKAKKGGGIYIMNSGTAEIRYCRASENEAQDDGGGVYVESGTLTLEGSTIGGEQFYDGTAPDKTKGNKAKKGGGIYLRGSSTTGEMTGGKVSYNKASEDGGGIFIGNLGLFTINSGEISGNTGKKGGGVGIFGNNSSFEMTGGTISENSASKGGGVYVEGFFRMKGDAIVTLSTDSDEDIAGKNDVYLFNDKLITLIGPLTGTRFPARITPTNYNEETEVLGGNPALLNSQHEKFRVTPKSGKRWYVLNNGKLKKKP